MEVSEKIMKESNRIEFKEKLTDGLEKEVGAFLNYTGGGIGSPIALREAILERIGADKGGYWKITGNFH
jgi:hypothetical protein